MIFAILRTLVLIARVHALWPDMPLERVAVAAAAAVRAETDAVRAELLLALAQHESDLEHRAVSWTACGQRVDRLWADQASQPPARGPLACGLTSAIAQDRASCAALMDPARAMRAAVTEIKEALAACRGAMGCALASYAGGNAGMAAWRARRRTTATAFAELFLRRAEQLGMEGPTS